MEKAKGSGMSGKAVKAIIGIISFIGFGTITNKVGSVYNGFLKLPQMECNINDNEKIFSVTDDFRSLTINLHPQMVIRFDNDIILPVHLKGYYEEETLHFNQQKECNAVKCHVEYVEELQKYMKEEIMLRVCLRNDKITANEINRRLHIYESTLGGVPYESEQGNEKKGYCIIEEDGIVINYDEHDSEISERLREAELEMKDNLEAIKEDETINSLIQGIADEIIRMTK